MYRSSLTRQTLFADRIRSPGSVAAAVSAAPSALGEAASATGITDPAYKACATNVVAGIGDGGIQKGANKARMVRINPFVTPCCRAVVPAPNAFGVHRNALQFAKRQRDCRTPQAGTYAQHSRNSRKRFEVRRPCGALDFTFARPHFLHSYQR